MVAIIITFIMQKGLSLGNKNNDIPWDKKMSSVNWLSPQGSYVTLTRGQKYPPGIFAKLLLQSPRMSSEPFPENHPSSWNGLKVRSLGRSLKRLLAGYRRKQTTPGLSCVPGKANVKRSCKMNLIYDITSRGSVLQNTRNEHTIQKNRLPCSVWGFKKNRVSQYKASHWIACSNIYFTLHISAGRLQMQPCTQ